MHIIKRAALGLAALFAASAPAAAQGTCPYIVYGAVLTVQQWQSCFTAKQNTLGYTPVNRAGDTMTGRLVTPSSVQVGGFNLSPSSTDPISPVNGDMWVTPSGFFVQVGGSKVQPYVPTGTSGGVAYFNSSNTLASSALLTSHGLMVGGGAGGAPSTLGSLGTTTTVLHGNASGAPTFGAVSLTADVSGILPSANGGTSNAFFTVSGPTTSAKTFSFPNASATVLTDNAVVTGAQGGTGVANTGKTITIGGNASTGSTFSTTGAFSTGGAFSTSSALSTTGAGATTLAFGASTQTYTFPTTTATIARTDAGQTFTGANTFSSGTTFSSALTYGGVTLSNAVTGTGNMVLSAGPTFTGTVSGAAATLTGTLTTNVTGGGVQCAQVSNTGVLSGTGSSCASPTAGQLPGTTTNDNASAGNVGEYITSSVASGSAVACVSAAVCNVTSISLTAGDWQVYGVTAFTGSGGAALSLFFMGISTTSATIPTVDTGAAGAVRLSGGQFVGPANPDLSGTFPNATTRISIASTTTVYLVAQPGFTGGTGAVYGFIGARRAR